MNATTVEVLAVVLGLLAGGCAGSGASAGGSGSARVNVSLLAEQAPSVIRMTVRVSAGTGPSFEPMSVDLPRSGASWSGYVTGIPAGPGRLFEVTGRDATGATVFQGSDSADITPGGVVQLTIVMQTAPGNPYGNSVPVIERVSVSAQLVEALGTVTLKVTAHDPDVGDSITYQWSASSGQLATPTAAETVWTAPASGPTVAQISIMVSDNRGASATATVKVDVSGGRIVRGSRRVTYWPDPPTPGTSRPAPDVGTVAAPRAFALVGGTWEEHPGGSLQADGTFAAGSFDADGGYVIPGVPEGIVTLCLEPTPGSWSCTDTPSSDVDLGYDVLGRADAVLAASRTPVTLALDGLDPWNPMWEEVQMTSIGANVWDVAAPGPTFRGGDTAGAALVDWFAPPLAAGPLDLLASTDVLILHQLATRSIYVGTDIVFYAAAARATPAGTVTGISLADGQPATVPARLDAVATLATLDVTWDPAAFEALGGSMAPPRRVLAGGSGHALAVGASPTPLDGTGPVLPGGGPRLLRMVRPQGSFPIAAPLQYGQFLGAAWKEWTSARYAVPAAYLSPDATTPWVVEAAIEAMTPVAGGDGTMVPAVGPPLQVHLGDADAVADVTGVGLTPTIRWSPPSRGTPTHYAVDVWRLSTQDARTVATAVLHHVTTGVAITVPPRVLEPGGTYVARVAAVTGPVAVDTAPCRTASVESSGSLLTGTFSP